MNRKESGDFKESEEFNPSSSPVILFLGTLAVLYIFAVLGHLTAQNRLCKSEIIQKFIESHEGVELLYLCPHHVWLIWLWLIPAGVICWVVESKKLWAWIILPPLLYNFNIDPFAIIDSAIASVIKPS